MLRLKKKEKEKLVFVRDSPRSILKSCDVVKGSAECFLDISNGGYRSGWARWEPLLEEGQEGWIWAWGGEGRHLKPQKPEHHSLTVELSVLTFHVNVFSLVCFDGWWLALPPEKAPAFAARELQSRTPASTGPCLCSTAALRKPGVGTIHFKVGIMDKTSLLSHCLKIPWQSPRIKMQEKFPRK